MGWMNYLIGVEREGLRIRHNGKLAETPHPSEFGDRLENPLIGTDFGDAMLELRTYPQENAESCYRELLAVTRKALKLLYEKEELLWPYSLPYELPDEAHFPYNPYPGRPDLEEHERLISKIYGLRRNCICGIHVNFSISDAMFAKMRSEYPSVPSDKDEAYLKCARQVLQHEAALRYFFDASPTDYAYHLIQEDSWRNGPEGFRNEKAKMLDYCSMTAYLQSLKQTASYERLSAVRLKSKDKESFDEGIAQHGVERIEFRLCDIDPFDICGTAAQRVNLSGGTLIMRVRRLVGLDLPGVRAIVRRPEKHVRRSVPAPRKITVPQKAVDEALAEAGRTIRDPELALAFARAEAAAKTRYGSGRKRPPA